MYIEPSQLQEVLDALGDHLAAAGEHAHLIVIGGSALVALGLTVRATRDVDVVALVRDGALVTAEPLPESVALAAAAVARDFDLAPGWLNGQPTSLLDVGAGLPPGFLDRVVERTHRSALTVGFASRVDLIYLKLYALASRWEPRDRSDLEALGPNAAELRGAARWARTVDAPGPFDDALARALAALGVEDDGRDA